MKSQIIPLTQPEQDKLLTLLGGPQNLSIQQEPEFLEQTGCPSLEQWLEDAWIQRDIRAVISGKERVGPQPVLLTHRDENGGGVRLFYPTRDLLIQNIWADGEDHMRNMMAARPWAEAAEEIISQVDALTGACAARELSTIEIKLFWMGLWIAIRALGPIRNKSQATEMGRLVASMRSLVAACKQRGSDRSPQGRYHEAQLNSRRSLCENHNPVLDGFPELVEIAREVASHELGGYVVDEVGLRVEDYLDAVQMMARDGCNPAEVADPPARVCSALSRKQHRLKRLEREHSMPLTEEQADELEQPGDVEGQVITGIDWERTTIGLPADQVKALQAKMDGLNLQSAEAQDELGWSRSRAESLRRSLEPDRALGKKLRRRFAAYRRTR